MSGGGAFGAYQVGVLKAYVEEIGYLDVLAGSSVGALNAVVLASAPSLREGVERLERIWVEDAPDLLRLKLALASHLRLLGSMAAFLARHVAGAAALELDRGLVSQDELETFLRRHVDTTRLAAGPPVYVSLYKSEGGVRDLIRLAFSEIGLADTPDSQFKRLQDLSPKEQIEAVLGSAALPMIFGSRSVRSGRFADGGIGGRKRRQGATPVDPLIDESCDLAFVSHLGDGSPWSRDDYPALTVVEIRPRTTIGRGLLRDLFERDRGILRSWLNRGYEDARSQLGRVLDAAGARTRLALSAAVLAESEAARKRGDAMRHATMSKLDKP